jgi:hypothetical protein
MYIVLRVRLGWQANDIAFNITIGLQDSQFAAKTIRIGMLMLRNTKKMLQKVDMNIKGCIILGKMVTEGVKKC